MAQLHIKTTEIQLKFRAFHKRWQHHILKFSFEFNYHAIIRSIFSWEIDMGEMLFRRIWFLYYLSVFSTIIFLCSFLEICLPEKNFLPYDLIKITKLKKCSSVLSSIISWHDFLNFIFGEEAWKCINLKKVCFDQMSIKFDIVFFGIPHWMELTPLTSQPSGTRKNHD